jgi:hypothetical protein
MAIHKDLTGDEAIHEIMYVQNGDPGAVGAGKFWLDTTGGATLTAGAILKQRDAPDTGWTTRADVKTALDLKAALASPTFTGTPAAPTAAPGTNTTQIATTAFVEAAVAAGGGGSGTAPLTPDSEPASPNAMDDEFDTGSTIDTGLWTANNATNLTNSVTGGALLLSITGANASVNQRGHYQALPGGASWEFETKVTVLGDADSNSFEAGIWLLESATGKILSLHVGWSAGPLIWTSRWTNVTTFGATINTVTPAVTPVQNPYYLRVELNGANYICKYSKTGHVWTTLSTVALTTPFTTAADRIGVKLYNDAAGNASAYGMFEHFRRIA